MPEIHTAFFGPCADYRIECDFHKGVKIVTHHIWHDVEEVLTDEQLEIFDLVVISRICPCFGLVAKFIMSKWMILVVWKDETQVFDIPGHEEKVARVYLEAKKDEAIDNLITTLMLVDLLS